MALIAVLKKKWPARLLLLGALLLAGLLGQGALALLERHYAAARQFTFNLAATAAATANDRQAVPAGAVIDKVVVAGHFSDWADDNPQYRLTPGADGNWHAALTLRPGRHQYKYVLYLHGVDKPLWVRDVGNPDVSQDAYGTYNSLLEIPDLADIGETALGAWLAVLLLLLAYSLFEPAIAYLLRRRMAFRYKLLLSMLLFVSLSNLLLMAYQVHAGRQLVKQGVIDSVHLMHLAIAAEGIDFEQLDTSGPQLEAAIKKTLWNATVRVEKAEQSASQVTLSDLAVLGPRFELLALMHRQQNDSLQSERASRYGFPDRQHYFTSGVFAPILAQARAMPLVDQTIFGQPAPQVMTMETGATRRASYLLGFSTFVSPIMIKSKLVGYYAGTIQTKLYGAEIERGIAINLLLVALVLVLAALTLVNIGRAVTASLSTLVAWTKKINRGDFSGHVDIASGDEIEELASNFDAMRQSLAHSFARIEEQNALLHTEAYADSLTGLPNRKKMDADAAAQAVEALVLINIDSFTALKGFYGTEAGDRVLFEAAKRLQQRGDERFNLYRINTDDFVITLCQPTAPEALSELCRQLCLRVSSGYYLAERQEITISVTAGASCRTDGEAIDRSLLHQATIALRIAKQERVEHLVFRSSMGESQKFEHNMIWARRIKLAIDDDRIVPYFQPILNNASATVGKFECLARLIDIDGTVVGPYQFLDIAKQARLYPLITQIMVRKAFAAFRDNEFTFSLNVTIEDILDPATFDYLIAILEANPDAARRTIFEITESAEITNYEMVRKFISRMRSYGCQIAIDDFGAGYSNFSHIMSLKVDFIKIDGSIIKDMDSNPNSHLIAATIADFARKLGTPTVAEFVRSKQIAALVNALGIDFSQGYYIGMPQPDLVLHQLQIQDDFIG